MATRRHFLTGLAAAGMTPTVGWADLGGPSHLSAAKTPEGAFVLCGLSTDGALRFQVPLPARGHAAAAHPHRVEAVLFARRPGTYAIVIDCQSGAWVHQLEAPEGHHFYGHGAFSVDGARLYTTENVAETGEGRVGLWDVAAGYRRIGSVASGGIGPHELLRLPGRDDLAVANGGIRTHPSSGRDPLNLSDMAPNLTVMSPDGTILDQVAPETAYHQNSLRHIAAGPGGTVACAFQWQGDPFEAPPLMALYHPQTGLRWADGPAYIWRALSGYAGSVAALPGGGFALTSPRGGVLQVFDALGQFQTQSRRADICGVSSGGLASDGSGGVHRITPDGLEPLADHSLAFDNHLVAIG